MSDSFYSLEGKKLYFSTDATKWLYEMLLYMGEKQSSQDPDRMAVIKWLQTQVEQGIDSARAFNLNHLPQELQGDMRLLVLAKLLESLFHELLNQAPDTWPDKKRNKDWEDAKFRLMWADKVSSLHALVSEAISQDKRPAMLQGN